VVLVADHPRPEAFLEQMSLSAMPAIETLRVQAVQPVHHPRQLLARPFDDQVVMGPEQRPGDEAGSEQIGGLVEEIDERGAVDVVDEDEAAAGASGTRMEEPVGEPATRSTRHGSDGRAAAAGAPAIVTLSLQGLSLGHGR
jgi:hypothetical protein